MASISFLDNTAGVYLLVAAARTGKSVNVKKAQFMAAWEMENVRDKLAAGGARDRCRDAGNVVLQIVLKNS